MLLCPSFEVICFIFVIKLLKLWLFWKFFWNNCISIQIYNILVGGTGLKYSHDTANNVRMLTTDED